VRRLVALAALAVLLVGCSDTVPGGKHVTTPTPDTIIGKVATVSPAAAGKSVFASTGCSACHVFEPAGSTGKVGPDLDNLAAYAAKAKMGSLAKFTETSIIDPGAYIAPGYTNAMPPTYGKSLTSQQVADLVAFLTTSH
jgi:cytochrome c551/c552